MNLLTSIPMPPQVAALPRTARGYPIPYVAGWSSEMPYRVERVERYGGKLALVSSGRMGDGVPELGKMDAGRQRECWEQRRCQVCHGWLPRRGAWWLTGLVEHNANGHMIREPWACVSCLAYALQVCPALVGRSRLSELLILRVTAYSTLMTMTSLAGLRGDKDLDSSVVLAADGTHEGDDTAVGYIKAVPTQFVTMTVPEFLDRAARAA